MHTQEDRNEVLRLHELGLSTRAISKKIGISKSTIHNWCSKFAAELTINDMSRKKSKPTRYIATSAPQNVENIQSSIPETDAQKIARLERELRNAQLRADFYEEMVNVAEEQFNISIRKKAGAKR